jgi:hypothetical protein
MQLWYSKYCRLYDMQLTEGISVKISVFLHTKLKVLAKIGWYIKLRSANVISISEICEQFESQAVC